MKYPNIEAERGRTGMTKSALATEIGVSPDTMQNWQNGKNDIPASKLVAMADLFKVSTDYLLGRVGANA